MAFADAFCMAYKIKHYFKRIIKSYIPLTMLTGYLSLFDVLSKETGTTKNRLMINFQTFRDAFRKFEVNEVAFVKSEDNIADVPNKVKSVCFNDKYFIWQATTFHYTMNTQRQWQG